MVKSIKKVHSDGVIHYLNENYYYHNETGPAIEYPEDYLISSLAGHKRWYVKGIIIGATYTDSTTVRLISSNEEFLQLMRLKAFW